MARQTIKPKPKPATTKRTAKTPAAKRGTKEKGIECEVAMTLARETPGTFRYEADVDDVEITTLYIRKQGRTKAPTQITVTVAAS